MGGHQPHPGLRQRRSRTVQGGDHRVRAARACERNAHESDQPKCARPFPSSRTSAQPANSSSTRHPRSTRCGCRAATVRNSRPNPIRSRGSRSPRPLRARSQGRSRRRTADGDAVQRSAAEPRPHPDLEVRNAQIDGAGVTGSSLPLNDTPSIGAAIVAVYGDASRAVDGGPISDYVWSDHQSAEVRVRHEGSGRDSRLRTRPLSDPPSTASANPTRAFDPVRRARSPRHPGQSSARRWDLPPTLRQLRRRHLPPAGACAVAWMTSGHLPRRPQLPTPTSRGSRPSRRHARSSTRRSTQPSSAAPRPCSGHPAPRSCSIAAANVLLVIALARELGAAAARRRRLPCLAARHPAVDHISRLRHEPRAAADSGDRGVARLTHRPTRARPPCRLRVAVARRSPALTTRSSVASPSLSP